MGEVALMPPRQVVDHPDPDAGFEQHVDHVAADESGATGDNADGRRAHAASIAFIVRTLK